MNQQSSTDLSASVNVSPDAISRRAYELWESEGRPEGCDQRHWLQAEQELAGSTGRVPARNSDVTPLQGTRAAAAASASASRESNGAAGAKRGTASGLMQEKNGGVTQNGTKRKPAAAPAL